MLAPEATATSVLPLSLSAGDGRLHPGDRQGAGRLQDRAGVLEHILDRRADGVVVDADDLVDIQLRQPESFLADLFHRHAIGKNAHARQRDALALAQRTRHGIGILRLDADDPDFRPQPLDVGRHAGDQAAAADRNVDRMDRAGMLAQQLHRHRALPGDHVGIVVGMDKGRLRFLGQLGGVGAGLIVVVAMQDDLRAARRHRFDLDPGRGGRHHDGGRHAQLLRGQRHALRVIAGRCRHHAARQLGRLSAWPSCCRRRGT